MTSTPNYIPQRDYKARNYEPFGCGTKDLCGDCKLYYKKLYDKGLVSTPDTPICNGHIAEPISQLTPEDFNTEEEFLDSQVILDPIAWALKELDWEARWYQDEFNSCTARFKVVRSGRRSGKSEGACVGILHRTYTREYYKTLMLAPYEAQIQMLFDILRKFVYSNKNLKSSLKGDTKNPQRLEFHNGSVILGMSAGSKTSAGSDKIRGQDANLIYIDEFDYIPESDIDAVVAILASHPDCEMWATSTPTGEHRKFYTYITDKEQGYKEFWTIAQESPTWTEHTEKMLRAQYGAISGTSPQWDHEILAEFGEQEAGVFKNSSIDRCLKEYDMNAIQPSRGHYILGVDWNKNGGTHMVIVEKALSIQDGDHFRLLKKIIISPSEFIQTKTVDDIIQLNEAWEFTDIFCDQGYGSTQIEMLKRFGLQHPGTRLHRKVMGLEMQRQIEVRDPTSGLVRRTPVKPFLVNTLANTVDLVRIVLPVSEDTRSTRSNELMGVVQQMRNFRIEGQSVHGLPKYSQGQDHTLTALMVAIGGHELKYGTISRIYHSSTVGFATNIDEKIIDNDGEEIQSEIIKNLKLAESRKLNEEGSIIKHIKHAGSIRDLRELRKSLKSGDGRFDAEGFRRLTSSYHRRRSLNQSPDRRTDF